jgi:hypothetical protein
MRRKGVRVMEFGMKVRLRAESKKKIQLANI